MAVDSGRIFHVTLAKCGSQWVRDVLTAPEIIQCSRYPHSRINPRLNQENPLAGISAKTFTGPIYSLDAWRWKSVKEFDDRAVVVIRDPRDRMISEMFSKLYSHGVGNAIDFGRRLLHALPDDDSRVDFMMYQLLSGGVVKFYESWAESKDQSAFVSSYEDLVSNQYAEFRKIVDWLGWAVAKETLEVVVDRFSFEKRSGRKAGEIDKFSHYRRGVVGDWRNYFKRDHGRLWEQYFPGFLREIRYEQSDDWWQSLPERESESDTWSLSDSDESVSRVLQVQLRKAQQSLIEKEKVIQDLISVAQPVGREPAQHSATFNFLRRFALK